MKQNQHLINRDLRKDIKNIVDSSPTGEESVSYIRSELRYKDWHSLGNFSKTLDILTANDIPYEQRGNYFFVKKFK